MTPVAITCKSCGSPAREGQHFCAVCASPLKPASSAEGAGRGPEHPPESNLAYTDAWDSVLPRLQEGLFGEFVISRELGRGGMAAVFLAHQVKLDRKVAIKVMAPTLMSGLGLADRFRDEATTVARLDHPNIISIYEVREAAGLQLFIMQYVAGRSLERALRQYGRLPVPIVRAVLFEVGSALAYAHRREVIHRDVKPGNVLLSLDGRVIVGDFGIAKVAASSTRTQTGVVVGTPAYMSPEQCWGRPLTWSADQYSLGIVAFEMLTGAPPFAGSGYGVMRSHTEEPPADILTVRPDCPPDMAAAVEKMLAKRPDDRFPTMSAALAALGATRMAVDEAAQDAIGHLAVPLPEEEGVVIVHTPASPAPHRTTEPAPELVSPLTAPAPIPGPVTRVLRAAFETTGAARGALAAWWMRAVAVGRAVSRSLAARSWRRPANELAIAMGAGGVLVILVAIAVVGRGPRRPADRPSRGISIDTVAKSGAESTAVSGGAVPVAGDSTAVASRSDSLGTVVDSAVVDSAAPHSLTLTRRSGTRSTVLLVGDSVLLVADARDLRNQTIRDATVAWRISDSLVMSRAPSGWLRARAPGSVSVRVSVDTLAQSRRFVVRARPAPGSPVTVPRVDTAPAAPVDPAADRDAIDRAVGVFVRSVLAGRDTVEIRRLYRAATPADADVRDSFVREITTKRNMTIRPEGNPSPPTIAGNRAHADLRITLKLERGLGRRDEIHQLTLGADLSRAGDRWIISAFTLAGGFR